MLTERVRPAGQTAAWWAREQQHPLPRSTRCAAVRCVPATPAPPAACARHHTPPAAPASAAPAGCHRGLQTATGRHLARRPPPPLTPPCSTRPAACQRLARRRRQQAAVRCLRPTRDTARSSVPGARGRWQPAAAAAWVTALRRHPCPETPQAAPRRATRGRRSATPLPPAATLGSSHAGPTALPPGRRHCSPPPVPPRPPPAPGWPCPQSCTHRALPPAPHPSPPARCAPCSRARRAMPQVGPCRWYM